MLLPANLQVKQARTERFAVPNLCPTTTSKMLMFPTNHNTTAITLSCIV